MRFKARDLTIAALFASSYSALVYLLAPLSFLQIQVRVANALIGAVPIFGMPAVLGIALGVLIGNIFSPLGPLDLLSALPSLLGLLALHKLSRRLGGLGVLLGLTAYSLIVSVWVALLLSHILGLPYPATFAYVLVGVSIATVGLGYLLYAQLSRMRALKGLAGRSPNRGPRPKAVVILSGGVDSSTVAYWAKAEGFDVHCLSFDYGQRASKELLSAKAIAEGLGAPFKPIDLSALKGIFGGATALCDESAPMPSAFEPALIVPFRNAILLSIAVAHAASIGAEAVFYGAQGSDAPFYPDCREPFFKAFQRAARLGTGSEIRVDAPLHGLGKSEVVALGSRLGVPYGLTWSCYLGGERHCGRCESCLNRKRAFEEAGVEDPTEYEA